MEKALLPLSHLIKWKGLRKLHGPSFPALLMSPNNVRAHGKLSRHRSRIKTLSYVFFLSWYQIGKINPNSVYFRAQKLLRVFWRCLSFISSSICKHYLMWNVLVDGWRWRPRIKGPFSRDNEGWGQRTQRRLETGLIVSLLVTRDCIHGFHY